MGFMAPTKNGVDPFTCLSIIQKAIRRADERLAVAYLYELGRSSKQYRSMLVNYLQQVILYEDIGPADLPTAIYVQLSLRQAKLASQEPRADDPKSERWSLPAITAVVAMCRMGKSRIAAHLWGVVDGKPLPDPGPAADLPPVPDWALDMHTAEGKRMGRGIDHFLDNLQMAFEADDPAFDPFKAEAHANWRKMAEDEKAANEARAKARSMGSAKQTTKPSLFAGEPGW